jgi:uncharacterized small protein (DUF1192 family)
MANLISKLSVTQLEQAIAIRQNIERLEAELDAIGSDSAPAKPVRRRLTVESLAGGEYTPVKKRRTMSPEARARIAAAQKARWAKARSAK